MSNETPKPAALPKRSLWQRMVRLTTYRLLIPIKRARHAPEYGARGVMVGMAWAMTPLVGIQMYLVFMTWLIARRLFRWNFSLIIGLAWTWTTNVITLFPIYQGLGAGNGRRIAPLVGARRLARLSLGISLCPPTTRQGNKENPHDRLIQ
jgi:hypothetical protein